MSYKKSLLIFFIFLFLSISLINAQDESEEGYSGKLTVTNTGAGTITITGPGKMPAHYCGNKILESYIGEQCDGSTGSDTCVSLGYDTGDLSCKSDCTFDTSLCTIIQNPPGDTGATSSGGGGGGGSGGGSSLCVENWVCEEWGKCKDETQSRTCSDVNKCGTETIKPIIARGCIIEGESGEEALGVSGSEISQESNSFISRLTGAVIGGGTGSVIGVVVFLVAIAGISTYVYAKRKKS